MALEGRERRGEESVPMASAEQTVSQLRRVAIDASAARGRSESLTESVWDFLLTATLLRKISPG